MSPVFYIMTIIVRGSRNKPFVNVASFGTEVYAIRGLYGKHPIKYIL